MTEWVGLSGKSQSHLTKASGWDYPENPRFRGWVGFSYPIGVISPSPTPPRPKDLTGWPEAPDSPRARWAERGKITARKTEKRKWYDKVKKCK